MSHRHSLSLFAAALVSFATLGDARADGGYAEPPPVHGGSPSDLPSAHVASDPSERPVFDPSLELRDPNASVFRLLVGPAGKLDARGAEPGLFVATEFGSGPAGLRLEADWLGVGDPRGVAQYTGQLTLDFGGRSRIHPVLGAGAGVARTMSSTSADGVADDKHGATLGIGAARAGVSFRLPFEETDARIAVDATGIFPAIKGSDAPRGLTPWATGTLGVMIGF
jgi:hypothetical protein